MAKQIKFGTDGWRGIIADSFTFEGVRMVAPAVAEVLYALAEEKNRQIVVGYDRRFLSQEFASAVAEVLAKIGFDVLLAKSFAPTPAISWSAFHTGSLGAIVITASHNPYQYSGLKIKGSFGGSVGREVTNLVEQKLASGQSDFSLGQAGTITEFDPWSSYVQELQTKVDIALIKSLIDANDLAIYADVMHGSAASGLSRLLGTPITELHSNSDPLFGGKSPEPLERNLHELKEIVAHSSSVLAVGFAFDGDSDRLACVDKQQFLSSQLLIPILTQHLVENRQKTGALIKTISGSDLIQKVGEFYYLPVYETPVGFKYLAEQMLSKPTVIAGEESGGIGYGDHIPERDALLSALYILEAIAMSRTNLTDLYRQLQAQVNFDFAYDRLDQHLTSSEAVARVYQALQDHPPQSIGGIPVVAVTNPDGFKFRLANQGWLLVRFSGTEPLLRMYCEAPTLESVHSMLEWMQRWINTEVLNICVADG